MNSCTITYRSGPDLSVVKKHKEQFASNVELEQFLRGMFIAGATKIKTSTKPVFYRCRLFIAGRVVSSSVHDTIDKAKAVGQHHAAGSGRSTYALSETTSPRV